MDPVTLGLCKQIELDLEVQKASRNAPTGNRGSRPRSALGRRGVGRHDTPTEVQSEEEAGIDEVFGTSEPTPNRKKRPPKRRRTISTPIRCSPSSSPTG
jgi:hypothetical protein